MVRGLQAPFQAVSDTHPFCVETVARDRGNLQDGVDTII